MASSSIRSRRRPKAERVREILAAARDVFAEQGYDAAPVAEIARRAGVVEGTIYKHFDSKRDLLFRVMSDFYESLIHDVETGLGAVRGAENRLRFIIGRHLRAFSADRGLCRLLIREIRPDGDLYGTAFEDLNRRYTRAALRAIEDGMAGGDFRSDISPVMVRHMIYGAVEHAVWRFVFRGGKLDVDAIAGDLTNAVLRGIVAGSAKASDEVERLAERVAGLERRLGRGRNDAAHA
jgi:AcrR family transcriptional regulator